MTMTAKFNGFCTACKGTITAGQRINWVRGGGSSHANADACNAARIAQQQADALRACTGSVKVTVTDGPVVAIARPTVDLGALVAFLRNARDRGLKHPKTRFAAPGNGELLLTLAPMTGKNPGAVYVKLNGEYVGKVTADGRAFGLDTLLPTLRNIEANPQEAAVAYGKLSGCCSFCNANLTDDRTGSSVEVGYGPKCAKNYGLPHKPKGHAKVQPVVNVPVLIVADDADCLPGEGGAAYPLATYAASTQFVADDSEWEAMRDAGEDYANGPELGDVAEQVTDDELGGL